VEVIMTMLENTVVDGCGKWVRQWTATDHCGNTATAVQIITVVDTEAPGLVGVPADVTVSCDAVPVVPVVTATDKCDQTLEVIFTVASTAADGCGYIYRTWSVTDHCGNSASATQKITVTDNTAPVIVCPADVILTVQGGQTSSTWTVVYPTATDNCSAPGLITFTGVRQDGLNLSDPYLVGTTTTITWKATDVCGNVSSECTHYITVKQGCISLNAKVMLEGAMMNLVNTLDYYTDSMRTTLYVKRLLPGQTYRNLSGELIPVPAGQPYSAAPWNYAGTEGSLYTSDGTAVSTAGYPATVVDWVLVSLRSTVNGASLCRKAALLHKDGTIELPGGFNCCDQNMSGSYYLVVEHRSHLLVMSDKPLQVINGTITYDFTTQQSYRDPTKPAYVGQKLIKGLKYAMYAGNGMQVPGSTAADTDANSDDQKYWGDRTGLVGYLISDYNLNGDTNADDQALWERNNGLTTGVPRD